MSEHMTTEEQAHKIVAGLRCAIESWGLDNPRVWENHQHALVQVITGKHPDVSALVRGGRVAIELDCYGIRSPDYFVNGVVTEVERVLLGPNPASVVKVRVEHLQQTYLRYAQF